MAKTFNLIKNKELARWLAIVLIGIALILETVEFAFGISESGFSFEDLFVYLFDV